jgi:hypothetical protein
LVLDEYGFGDHGTRAWTGSRATVVTRWRKRTARSRTARSYKIAKS